MRKLFMFGSIIFFLAITTGCSSNSNILTLKGDIQNNISPATSTVSGKIIEMKKNQGETVKKGDIIAVIDNTNQKFNVDQMQALVNMKKAKLEELQIGTRQEQIDQAEAQVRAAKAQVELLTSGNRNQQIEQAKNEVSIAQDAVNSAQTSYDYINTQYNNTTQLYQSGAVAKSTLDDAKYKLDTASTQLSSAKLKFESANEQLSLLQEGATSQAIDTAKANYDAANSQLTLLKNGSTKQAIAAAQGDLDQVLAQLNQAQNNLNNCNLVALNDGIIISKNYELGDVVNIGSDVADIAISNDLYVLCYIPDQYLDKISYNQSLNVTTAIGNQTGTVNYIALKHEYTPKDKQSTSDSKHIATKIKVSITDSDGTLKSGMTANVEIPIK
ncbi:HlyD family secretion protein [Clostridium saccharoperbutylacetonicum]|uniref:Multidrug resistance efflux pump n=1 Tax=Clostridium saccharoperbutylacetonicum N1-4(HMT) TaxID=931276 RepID=M1MLP3_9CLOT|nr:HlyD family efflux transporter periplasmic adaptor subunit [Clostridium saccharoperbutylacetonicum]AGF58839.1 multidrug resistance efflux pump [Clostridium saccharoperbutylacetonicum N1-4(HMT)]NRT60377.1 HlyD family secretion protein [Clostridium saccharoperbutylacetonicum]NSB23690.1 HlyD family secretion protein [Clostridium saccharoperbutylacetonicum]NSB43061.1 HlyD family secretion protein [Clostridium saccharoperbutylacetonicum]